VAKITDLTIAQIENALDYCHETLDIEASWDKVYDEEAADPLLPTPFVEPDWDAIERKHKQDELDLESQVLDCGYSVGELRRAFHLVANRENWKFPIDAVVDSQYVPVLQYAVEFMTGSKPTFTQKAPRLTRVQAAGYYSAVGA
jgi:hypothetical protein